MADKPETAIPYTVQNPHRSNRVAGPRKPGRNRWKFVDILYCCRVITRGTRGITGYRGITGLSNN